MSDLREFHDIIYRSLFDMDTRALLIHFGLPPECYDDEEDDDLCDCMGLLALTALGEVQHGFYVWLKPRAYKSVTSVVAKDWLRAFAGAYAAKYKARAKELGGDLLTEMRV